MSVEGVGVALRFFNNLNISGGSRFSREGDTSPVRPDTMTFSIFQNKRIGTHWGRQRPPQSGSSNNTPI